ncbi:MAG TPA: hypothetical protein VFZ99_04370 [Terriglobales bacterium]
MNRILCFIAVLSLSCAGMAQGATAASSEKSQGKASNPQASTQQNVNPGAASTGATQQQAQPPASPPQPPAHRFPPAAKTHDEFEAYKAAESLPNIGAEEKAADDFAVKFPQSELRPLIYANLMRRYQQMDDPDKTLEMARKVLQFWPDDTMALVISATALTERTRDTDLDREQRYAEAKANAQKAIETADAGLMVPPNITEAQFQGVKHILLSMAYSALGMVELSQKDDMAAEQHFKQSIQMGGGQTDPLTYMRLALAQDHQRKYSEALASARTAVQSAPANSPLQGLAQQEVDRLAKLAAGSPATSGAPGANPPAKPSKSDTANPNGEPGNNPR